MLNPPLFTEELIFVTVFDAPFPIKPYEQVIVLPEPLLIIEKQSVTKFVVPLFIVEYLQIVLFSIPPPINE
jgi:hypothetical protein